MAASVAMEGRFSGTGTGEGGGFREAGWYGSEPSQEGVASDKRKH